MCEEIMVKTKQWLHWRPVCKVDMSVWNEMTTNTSVEIIFVLEHKNWEIVKVRNWKGQEHRNFDEHNRNLHREKFDEENTEIESEQWVERKN